MDEPNFGECIKVGIGIKDLALVFRENFDFPEQIKSFIDDLIMSGGVYISTGQALGEDAERQAAMQALEAYTYLSKDQPVYLIAYLATAGNKIEWETNQICGEIKEKTQAKAVNAGRTISDKIDGAVRVTLVVLEGEGPIEEESDEIDTSLDMIKNGLAQIFSNHFMSISDMEAGIKTLKIQEKGENEDDFSFFTVNPEHPLAFENRMARISGAEQVRDVLRGGYVKLGLAEVLQIEQALFDCCSSVRLAMAEVFFHLESGGGKQLEKLLKLEKESEMVKDAAEIALWRRRFRMEEGKPYISLFSRSMPLAQAILKFTKERGYDFYLHETDFEGCCWYYLNEGQDCKVRIIDKETLPEDCWQGFCKYLEGKERAFYEEDWHNIKSTFESVEVSYIPTIIIDRESPDNVSRKSTELHVPIDRAYYFRRTYPELCTDVLVGIIDLLIDKTPLKPRGYWSNYNGGDRRIEHDIKDE